MKLTKNTFFFFCFLFIVTLINGKTHCLHSNSTLHIVQSIPAQHQDQLGLVKDGLVVCLRLTEESNPCSRNSEHIHPFFNASLYKQFFFSTQSYISYTSNWLNQSDNYPLYIHHRQFRI